MPKKDYKILRNREKTGRKSAIFPIIFIIFSFALSFTCASLFSTYLSAGSFSFSKETTTLKTTGFHVYAISLASDSSMSPLKSLSDDTKDKGGAGYVGNIGSEYHLLASCYIEENDAKKVQASLLKNGINSQIVKIEINDISISVSTTASKQSALSSSLCLFKKTYLSLYDFSVAYDTKQETREEILLKVKNELLTIEEKQKEFSSSFSSGLTRDLLELKIKMAEIENLVEDLYKTSDDGNRFSAKLKSTYFKILFLQNELHEKLNVAN